MKKTSMTMAEYQGERVELRQLARKKGFNPQTIVDRWLKLGSPAVVDDATLFYPAQIGGASKKRLTLDGVETTIKELVAVSGLSEPSIYKRIRMHGHDLVWAHLDLDEARQKNALSAWKAKRAGKGSKQIPKVPVYDPADRSPGWCERKYEFLRRAGQSGYGGHVGRSVFCGRTSSGAVVYGGG